MSLLTWLCIGHYKAGLGLCQGSPRDTTGWHLIYTKEFGGESVGVPAGGTRD